MEEKLSVSQHLVLPAQEAAHGLDCMERSKEQQAREHEHGPLDQSCETYGQSSSSHNLSDWEEYSEYEVSHRDISSYKDLSDWEESMEHEISHKEDAIHQACPEGMFRDPQRNHPGKTTVTKASCKTAANTTSGPSPCGRMRLSRME